MYFSHHFWEHGIGGEKSPPLLCLFFTVCLVSLVKLSNAQLAHHSRETIRCSAGSSFSWNFPMLSYVSWNYPMLSCLVISWNYPMLSCLVISWNYPMLSCLVNLVKLSDAQLPRQSRETIRCSGASSSRETIRCSAASSISWNYPMLSCLVNIVKLSDAQLPRHLVNLSDGQLPRQSRETIRCTAASSSRETIRCSAASSSRESNQCSAASSSRETIRWLAASSISWNYPMHSCLVNLVKLSDTQLSRQSRETIWCWAKRAGITKSTLQRHKYFQKWNCKASFPIPTFCERLTYWTFEWIQCFKLLSSYSNIFFRAAIHIYLFFKLFNCKFT
jgi:hypothetical protein